MKHEFRLTIELGNDAMRTPQDLAIALRKLANTFLSDAEDDMVPTFGTIHDDNGNRVGDYVCRMPKTR